MARFRISVLRNPRSWCHTCSTSIPVSARTRSTVSRVSGPEPSSATTTWKSRRVWVAYPHSTSSSCRGWL